MRPCGVNVKVGAPSSLSNCARSAASLPAGAAISASLPENSAASMA
jgi:hypothetical protein